VFPIYILQTQIDDLSTIHKNEIQDMTGKRQLSQFPSWENKLFASIQSLDLLSSGHNYLFTWG
jgi:hypothetical protein